MITNSLKENTAITHPGKFHADDVFSGALLKLLNPNIQIIRTSNIPVNFKGVVFDIGFGKFDHHQKDNTHRENGTPYAAFGKLWKEYSHLLADTETAESVDKNLVQPIDAADNGKGTNLLSIMISKFNPAWNEDDVEEESFDYAVSVAMNILIYEIKAEKFRTNKKIIDHFGGIDDVNEAIKHYFEKPVLNAIISSKSGSLYADDIRRCLKFECAKEFPCDNHGEPCSPISNVWREYGSLITANTVTGSVQKSFFGCLDEVSVKNQKKDVLLNLMKDMEKHSPKYLEDLGITIQKWLCAEIESAESRLISREILVNAIRNTDDDEIIFLDKFYPWREILIDSLAKFVVYPSVRGGYSMHTVPITRSSSTSRLPFPDKWCASPIESVQEEVREITFCHRGNFLVTSSTIEGCYRAAEKASEYYIEKNFNGENKIILEIAKKASPYNCSTLENKISDLAIFEAEDIMEKFTHVYLRNPTEKEGLKIAQNLLKQHVDKEKFISNLSRPIDELLGMV